jgi:hypothetical protein
MNTDLEEHGRKRPWPNLKQYPSICLRGLRKTTKNCQDTQSSGRDLKTGHDFPWNLIKISSKLNNLA